MKENLFTIRYVAEQTGLSQDVIRIWERRYGAVQPQRTETDRRRYSEADLERLRLLKRVVEAHHPIGTIAKLPTAELMELLPTEAPPEEALELQKSLEAVRNLDSALLTSILNRFFVQNGSFQLIDDLITPLMTRVGQLWETGKLQVSEEHMVSGVIRGFLEMLRARTEGNSTDTIIVATPAGEWHELGALTAAIHAAAAGWNVMYLGVNLPASEIASASSRLGARAIAISVMHSGNAQELSRELKILRKNITDAVLIFAGGAAANASKKTLQQINAVVCRDLEEFRTRLAAIKS